MSAAFGRLSVETLDDVATLIKAKPAAFGRLSVETLSYTRQIRSPTSRLRAAEC